MSNIDSRTSTSARRRFKNTVHLDSIIARSQRSQEFCNTIPPTTAVILQCRERQLRADCVVKVQNYRVMIFWLEDDPTDERQSV
jgi:hypothetical protein